MKVSIFKDAFTNTPKRYSLTVYQALQRIIDGDSKSLIDKIREQSTKEGRNKIKVNLTGVCFGGTFERRAIAGLKESSGFMIVDFDNLKNAAEFRDNLRLNDFIFAAWVSPSNEGVKALVKIPKVNDNDQYASYYTAFINALNEPHTDTAGKDISRLCFESYDPDLWINDNSQIWTDFDQIELERPIIHQGIVTVPCTDQDEIVRRLMKWFEGKYNPSQRNNSINILAFTFNLFGVDITTAKNIALRYEQKDFRAKEIITTVDSAYSKKELHGTQKFEDKKKRDYITSFSRGRDRSEVKKKFKEVDPEVIDTIFEQSKEINFWEEKENGTIKIVHNYYRDYLHHLGFNKILFSNDTKVISFIRKEGKFVREYQPEEVKDFVLTDIESRGEMDVWNTLAGNIKYFSESYLSMLNSKIVDVEKDGKDYALFYFQNTVVKVTKDNIEEINYEDLPKSVWETQVIKRDYLKADHHESEFRTFVWRACGENVDNYNAFKSVIGRMLHTYKTTSKNVAIIANDDDMSDTPNGGSGKSLLWLAISKLRKVSEIDGKNFDFSKSFNYQTVPIDTQVLVYDDIIRSFDFQRLFSVITGGLTIEYKSKNAIKLDVTESPQIYITTNYAVKGVGGSFDRRKHEIEFSSHYNANFSPEDEFGHRFFDEWTTEEWARFDNYMMNCLQYFLKNNLVKQSLSTIRDKKFKVETSTEWFEFAKSRRFKLNKRYYKSNIKADFLDENDHYKEFTNKTAKRWIDSFASWKHWNVEHSKDTKGHYFCFNDGTNLDVDSNELESDDNLPF